MSNKDLSDQEQLEAGLADDTRQLKRLAYVIMALTAVGIVLALAALFWSFKK